MCHGRKVIWSRETNIPPVVVTNCMLPMPHDVNASMKSKYTGGIPYSIEYVFFVNWTCPYHLHIAQNLNVRWTHNFVHLHFLVFMIKGCRYLFYATTEIWLILWRVVFVCTFSVFAGPQSHFIGVITYLCD